MKTLYSIVALAFLYACNSPQEKFQSFGDEISSIGNIEVTQLLADVDETEKTFKVKGTVEEVCQMKGCWLTLKNEDGASIRITFKDYGFFVPKDISGREIILEGVAYKEELEEDVAKHYAEDGGLEYDESMRDQITFVASGVLVAEI